MFYTAHKKELQALILTVTLLSLGYIRKIAMIIAVVHFHMKYKRWAIHEHELQLCAESAMWLWMWIGGYSFVMDFVSNVAEHLVYVNFIVKHLNQIESYWHFP